MKTNKLPDRHSITLSPTAEAALAKLKARPGGFILSKFVQDKLVAEVAPPNTNKK